MNLIRIGMPNHGKEKRCSDEEAGDGAVGENNLRAHHKSSARERDCHNALLATTLQNFNGSKEANLSYSSQSGIGQAKDVRSATNPFKKLRGLSVSLKCKAKQKKTKLEGRGGGCLRHFAIKNFECAKNVHCCICGD